MRSCKDCIHCRATIYLKDAAIPKFRQWWANKRIVFGGIRCEKYMWFSGNGKEFRYKSWQKTSDRFKMAEECPFFERG